MALAGTGGCQTGTTTGTLPEAPAFYAALPPEMVLPWKNTASEVRCHDVPYPDAESFLSFMKRHEGLDKRFVDIRKTFSHVTRLTHRSRLNVATYLLNYIRRDCTYDGDTEKLSDHGRGSDRIPGGKKGRATVPSRESDPVRAAAAPLPLRE